MQYSLFAFHCFLSAVHALIHIIFIVTETPPYYREVVESPFEYKSVFCKFMRFKQLNLYTGLEQLFILHRMNRMRMYTG